jgi:DtxR family transcriptional regulator, Mn-dependent transcriptional regulator
MIATGTVTASLEDYLEAIFHIVAEKNAARPKDIACRLKVSNASVTGALRSLAEKELVHYAPYDLVTLTDNGVRTAKDVVRRHEVLRDFFVGVLAVEHKVADEAACRMEHAIPTVILERLIQFAEFIEVCPRAGVQWFADRGYQCAKTNKNADCVKCLETALAETRKRVRHGPGKGDLMTTLNAIKPGEKAKVVKVNIRGEVGSRILEMGLLKGTIVEVERVAPLGDPIDVKVKGYHLSLRKEEASGVQVSRL